MDAEHVYVSTACVHEKHEECRKACKFCGGACRCSCHAVRDEPVIPTETTSAEGTGVTFRTFIPRECVNCGEFIRTPEEVLGGCADLDDAAHELETPMQALARQQGFWQKTAEDMTTAAAKTGELVSAHDVTVRVRAVMLERGERMIDAKDLEAIE